jgi:hypothetical protein
VNNIAQVENSLTKKAPLYARYAPSSPPKIDSLSFFIVTENADDAKK